MNPTEIIVSKTDDVRVMMIDVMNVCLNHFKSKLVKELDLKDNAIVEIEKFGNANKASKRFGVHPNTIRNWAKSGHYKKYMVEGVSLYCFSEIEIHIKKQTIN